MLANLVGAAAAAKEKAPAAHAHVSGERNRMAAQFREARLENKRRRSSALP
jgi:hypothetical protein